MSGNLTVLLAFVLVFGYVRESQALKCYNCTSYYDGDVCDDDFALNKTLAIECPEPPTDAELPDANALKAISCRKLRQTVNGVVRVTRQCGYIPEKDQSRSNKCLKEAFTSFTSSFYCECNTDLCNGATTTFLKWSIIGLVLATNLLVVCSVS